MTDDGGDAAFINLPIFMFPRQKSKIPSPLSPQSPYFKRIPDLYRPRFLFRPASTPCSVRVRANSLWLEKGSPFFHDQSLNFSKRSLNGVFAAGSMTQHSSMNSLITSISER